MELEYLIIFFIAMIALAIILWAAYFVVSKNQDAKNAASPVCTEYARVIDNRLPTGTYIPKYATAWVLFELENGERKEFVVPATEHYVVGDAGMLKWQGTKILSFERNIAAN